MSEPKLSGIDGYYISNDGKKLMYSASNTYGIVNIADKLKVGDGKLNTAAVKVYVDPQKEWRRMFDEIWRIERDFFYVSNLNGANVAAIKKKYEIFLPYIAHRDELNYLFSDMLGELVVGHMFVGAGDYPEAKK